MFEIILITNPLLTFDKLVELGILSFIISYSRSKRQKTPGVSSKKDPSFFASCKMEFSSISACNLDLRRSVKWFLPCLFFSGFWFFTFSFPFLLLQNTPLHYLTHYDIHSLSHLLTILSKRANAFTTFDLLIGHRWIFPQTLKIYWHSMPIKEKQPVNMCVPYLLCKASSWVNSVCW